MVPSRQVFVAEVMIGQNNCSGDFARALLAATPAHLRIDDPRGRQSHPGRAKRLAVMERGLVKMQARAQDLTVAYNDELLLLALAASYIRGWIQNDVLRLWLRSRHPEDLVFLERLATRSDRSKKAKRSMKLSYASPIEDYAQVVSD
jgi:hypothetical protein